MKYERNSKHDPTKFGNKKISSWPVDAGANCAVSRQRSKKKKVCRQSVPSLCRDLKVQRGFPLDFIYPPKTQSPHEILTDSIYYYKLYFFYYIGIRYIPAGIRWY